MARISSSNSKAIAKPTDTITNIDCDGTTNRNDNSNRQTNAATDPKPDTASSDLAKTNINAEKEVPDTKEASDTYAERDSDHSLKAKGTSM